MIFVISSPSSSTTGFVTFILVIFLIFNAANILNHCQVQALLFQKKPIFQIDKLNVMKQPESKNKSHKKVNLNYGFWFGQQHSIVFDCCFGLK
jgi:hypothetical protein